MVNAVIENDFSKVSIQALEVAMGPGEKLKDVTAELQRAHNEIFYTAAAKKEGSALAISGRSSLMEASMRIMFWNQTNQCMVQVVMDKAIKREGKHAYDKYMDSIELSGHIDYTKRQAEKPADSFPSPFSANPLK